MDKMRKTAPVLPSGAMLRDPRTSKNDRWKDDSADARKGGDNHERWVSFTIPDGTSQLEVMQKGIAIDGNQALWSVGRGEYDSNEKSWSYAGPLSDRTQLAPPTRY